MFMYSEKARKFCEISTVDLTVTTQDKSTMEISQKFVAFSEYINFMRSIWFEITQREPVTSQSVSEGLDWY